VVIPLCIVGLIAGTDGLFLRAVPLEQRLISHNDDIRKKAQQALLGQSSEQKQQTVRRLIPALIQADPLARKWAAISFALVGPSAREAIPSLLQNVSDKETEVAQAARVALTEIGAPDAGQLPILIQALGNAHEGVRCEAAASIARLGSNAEPALPALFQALENKTSFPDCFVSTLVDLNSFIPGIETDLASRLHSANPVLLDHTLQVVQRLPVKSPPTLQLLLDVLSQNENEDIRQQAAEALSLRHAPEKGVPAALKACATLSANAQVRALAFSLFRKQSPPLPLAQKVILHALHDEDAGLRRSALEWLITQPTWTRSFAADLFQELHDPLPDHRRLALEALYHVAWHGRDHVQTIALMQRDHEADIRCLAVRQLVEMGAADRVSIDRLISDLRSQADPACAVESLALAGYFNGDVVPSMTRLLNDPDWRTQTRAVAVLLHLGRRAKPALSALAHAQKEGVPGAENAINHIYQAVAHDKHRK